MAPTDVTSKTSTAAIAKYDEALERLRARDRARDALVAAYFTARTHLADVDARVDKTRAAGNERIAQVTAAVSAKVEAALAARRPHVTALAAALVAVADNLGDQAAADTLSVTLADVRAARRTATSSQPAEQTPGEAPAHPGPASGANGMTAPPGGDGTTMPPDGDRTTMPPDGDRTTMPPDGDGASGQAENSLGHRPGNGRPAPAGPARA